MTANTQDETAKEDRPLTTADVVRLLHEVGDSKKLNLRGRNLQGIDLASFKLAGAILSKANLVNSHLFEIDLQGADLGEADLSSADLIGAHLQGANLSGANLSGANLSQANLSGANLSGANLRDANLSRCDFKQTNLSQAIMGQTVLVNVDLRTVKGLETVHHEDASGIDTATIYQSRGDIPVIFLRGAGVPDEFIDVIHSLIKSPIEYYTCFISYSNMDESFAKRLLADLQSQGIRCWFAPQDLRPGDRILPRIEENIRVYDKLLLILSQHSLESGWVEYEVETALAKESKEQRTVLFPIRIDNTVMEAKASWPALIRQTRHIGDFTDWRGYDGYQRAFSRLLHDLRAEAHQSPSWEEQPHSSGVFTHENTSTLRVRIVEEPLTAYNLTMILGALTELSTKCWLIAKNRFADLIEYTQTHNGRFPEEAGMVITRISYNSPFNMDWKADISPEGFAKALVTGLDGIKQSQARLEKAKLENQAKVQEIKEAEQKAERQSEMALLEQERQRLELEIRRTDLLEKQLEVQKKGIEYALEIAGNIVDTLHPGADPATRAMAIRTLLPNIIQLQNGKGLELALPPPSSE